MENNRENFENGAGSTDFGGQTEQNVTGSVNGGQTAEHTEESSTGAAQNGSQGVNPSAQSDGLYHYSYRDNKGAAGFDRYQTSTNPYGTVNRQNAGTYEAGNNQGYTQQGPAGAPRNSYAQQGPAGAPRGSYAQQGPAGASQGSYAQQGQTASAAYSGFEKNVNGAEAWYDSQRMNGGQGRTVNPSAAQNTAAGAAPKSHHKKKTDGGGSRGKGGKGNGVGRKVLGLVAAAVVFGLVAGAVFQGVRYGSDKVLGNNTTTTEKTASADTDSVSSENATTESTTPKLQTASSTTSTVYDVSTVAEKVMPSIVSITGTYVTTYQNWFDSYQQESTGAGSGIIIGKDDDYLYIVTNYHVVEDAKELTVSFVDDTTADATVKGYVENNDIAVATVKLSDISDDTLSQIQEIEVGSSEDLAVGSPCVAIGNALGYGQSVTVGYISALNREISTSDETVTVLQTDAAINPGNSGGALVNMNGQLIGINTAKYSDTSVEGIGYALPISDVQDIINDLIAGKSVASDGTTSGQAYLGIVAQTITSQYSELLGMPEGVYISSVESGSAAEECGLQSGDIICSLDGEDITDMDTFHDKIVEHEAGDKVTIVYYRNNNGNYEKQTATATLQAK